VDVAGAVAIDSKVVGLSLFIIKKRAVMARFLREAPFHQCAAIRCSGHVVKSSIVLNNRLLFVV
jgi:hypothetical protein